MGSLKEIYQYIPELTVPIVMMNNVTTSVAIAVGNVSSKNVSLREIPERVNAYSQNEWEIILPQTKKRKLSSQRVQQGLNCGSNLKFIRKEHSRSFTDSNSPL